MKAFVTPLAALATLFCPPPPPMAWRYWLPFACIPCTQSMPVEMSSPNCTSIITVSIKTCESLMSIDSMICSMVGMSSVRAITTSPLMRLSASTVTLSFESSPAFDSPLRWFTDLRWFAAVAVERVRLPPLPDFAFWFWFCFALDFELAALPIRSLIMSDTSSASAYLRR